MKVSKVYIDHVVIYPYFDENPEAMEAIVNMLEGVLTQEAYRHLMGIDEDLQYL